MKGMETNTCGSTTRCVIGGVLHNTERRFEVFVHDPLPDEVAIRLGQEAGIL